MGKRGPPKTPTKILAARGSWRAATRPNEPSFVGTPDPPAHLDVAAKAKWKEISPLLVNAGVLTTADADSLAAYCDTFSRYLKAKKIVEKKGLTTDDGRKRPEVAIVEKCSESMLRWLREFGMTPASRSNVKAESKKTDDPDDELFTPRIADTG